MGRYGETATQDTARRNSLLPPLSRGLGSYGSGEQELRTPHSGLCARDLRRLAVAVSLPYGLPITAPDSWLLTPVFRSGVSEA